MQTRTIVGATSVVLLTTLLLSISYGAGPYGLGDFVTAFGSGASPDERLIDIFFRSRLPRTLAAMLVGGGLALAATLLQTVTRNPLAEPGILGVNAGAVLGLTIGLSYFAAASTTEFMIWAGGGALAAITLVLCVAMWSRRTNPSHLILVGIATSAMLGGLANYLLMAFATTLEQFRFWNLGSLAGADLGALKATAPYVFVGCVVIVLMTGPLAVMQLGDDKAKTMGVHTGAVTVAVWIVAAVLTAAAVAIAGPIMFAGFLAAYLARAVVGPRLGRQLVCSAMFGMILLLVADVCARTVVRPYEIPVGVIIALVGTPLTIFAARSRAFRAALIRD